MSDDVVNHPSHYKRGGMECIDVVESMSFLRGNAVKYLWRAGQKAANGKTVQQATIEDLRKAKWYIEREIANLEATPDKTPRVDVGVRQRVVKLEPLIHDHAWRESANWPAKMLCGLCGKPPKEHAA